MSKESDYELEKMELLYINECATNAGLQTDVDTYRKAWEDSAKYAHKLELELEKTGGYFRAELNAAKNDYSRNRQLETANAELLEACKEALEEIEYWHKDMLSEDERNHPRGSGWARVYDNLTEAIRQHKGEGK